MSEREASSRPTQLGPYQLGVLLGKGGMGEVYKAFDERLGRWVAAKRLRDDAPARARERFRREARTLAQLGHPGIVQVFDVVKGDETDWIVMELVDGPTLAELQSSGPLDPGLAIDYARQIASALEAAYGSRIVHRDLKTENVMVLPSGHVKVLDFGLARRIASSSVDMTAVDGHIESVDAALSQPGRVLGTARSMSPEQAAGKTVDSRSDLFSLGVLLYEVLTGESPFRGDNLAQTLRQVMLFTPPPVAQINEKVPLELSRLVDRLLEKDPADRPQSAAEVEAELNRIGAGVGVERVTAAAQSDDAVVTTLLVTELVGSTRLVKELGDRRAAQLFQRHGRLISRLVEEHGGRSVGPQLALFSRPGKAASFALAYHRRLVELGLGARVGIHLGEVILRHNSVREIERGAQPTEVEGLAKSTAERLVSLAAAGQTLLTRTAYDVARRSLASEADVAREWRTHGRFHFQEIGDEVEVFELSVQGTAPLAAPLGSDAAWRLEPSEDLSSSRSADESGRRTNRRPTSSQQKSFGERRQITVLCCDLVAPGSAEIAPPDPETLSEILPQFLERAGELISRYEGTVGDTIGHRFVAYFGYPEAHEDDAIRAVRTSLELIDLQRQPLVGHLSTTLALRIGVHTGPAVITTSGAGREPLILGSTFEETATLQNRAEAGEILVSGATQQLAGRGFQLEKVQADGLADGQVWRVLAARDPTEAGSRMAVLPMVSRQGELELLLSRWRSAETGRGQAVLISGEAGLGKTRLVQAFRDLLPDSATRWWTAHASPFLKNSPLAPVIEMLRREILGSQTTEEPEAQLQLLEGFLAEYGLPRDEVAFLLAGLLGLPAEGRYPGSDPGPQVRRERTLEALVALLIEMSEVHPLVLAVEDLHWMDPSTLELLSLVIDGASSVPLLVLATSRPGGLPVWEQNLALTRIHLSHLDDREGAELIDQVAAGRELDPTLRAQILSRTDGVPLFIEELTKSVLESDWGSESFVIPATLRDSLTARLDHLGPIKSIAQSAAAIGRSFSYEFLAAVLQESEPDLLSKLEGLMAAALVYRKGFGSRARYFFKHALLQDIAYDSLLRSDRQALHRRIAEVLIEQLTDDRRARPEVVAHHLSRTGDPQQTELATEYWLDAGNRAASRCANPEAIEHLNAGLRHLETLPESHERNRRELSFQTALGQALSLVKGYGAPEVQLAFDRAHELCRQFGESPDLFKILLGLWHFYVVRAELETARDLGRQLLRLCRGQDSLRPIGQFALGSALFYAGDLEAAREHLEESIADQQTGEFDEVEQIKLNARSCLSIDLWQLGFADQALEQGREAIDRAQAADHLPSLAYSLNFAASLHASCRQVAACRERAQALHELSKKLGFFWLVSSNAILGWADAGREAEPEARAAGIARMKESLATYLSLGCRLGQTQILGRLAEGLLAHGDVDEGLKVVDQALAAVRETGERYWEGELHRLRAELLLAQGDGGPNHGEVERSLRTALAIARRQAAKALELRAAVSLCRLRRMGITESTAESSRQILESVYEWFTEGLSLEDLELARRELEEM